MKLFQRKIRLKMRIIDCHVHMEGPVDVDKLLRSMDSNGVEKSILLSHYERESLDVTRANLADTATAVNAAPGRLIGLARINPVIPGIIELTSEALTEMPYAGLKIIPDHWYVCDEKIEPFWEKMNELKARILFHTGILYGFEDGSKFNKPLYLEKLLHYPNIKFAMAHISWPWCDECLAVMGRMLDAAEWDKNKWQSYIDITPGPPPYIRKDAVKNAIEFCGVERLMFGSDSFVPKDMELKPQKEFIADYIRIFEELEISKKDQQRIFAGTAEELFGN
jgi:predicted TIM-barrel fold metal-dependent hydrolase